jgi:hypothetical protein
LKYKTKSLQHFSILVLYLKFNSNSGANMNNLDKIMQLQIAAQKAAPAYFIIKDDGAAYTCAECGKSDRDVFIKTFTPDNKRHALIHLKCVDSDWLENAKNVGSI